MLAQQKEIVARESTLERYQQQAHRRLLDELRSNVGAYLSAALEGRRRFLVPLPSAPGDVRHFVAERWLDCLEADERSRSAGVDPLAVFDIHRTEAKILPSRAQADLGVVARSRRFGSRRSAGKLAGAVGA